MRPLARLQQRQGRDQATQAQQVVEMGVGEQDAIEPAQAEPAPEQLALGPLTAIDQEPALPVHHDQRRQPPVDGRHTRRGAKENDFEHVLTTSRPPVELAL